MLTWDTVHLRACWKLDELGFVSVRARWAVGDSPRIDGYNPRMWCRHGGSSMLGS